MSDYAFSYDRDYARPAERALYVKVYGWMTFALLVTGLVAAVVASDPAFARGVARWFLAIVIAELAVVVGLSWFLPRMSAAFATGAFVFYAALNGLTFGLIFTLYTGESVAVAFLVTAGTFGAMSLYGWTTKRDLSTLGNLCTMALLGIVIASLVNVIFRSPAISWAVTYVGVLVFVGLTAYDTQVLKRLDRRVGAGGGDEARKLSIIVALKLYLDFINIFLFMLRILGRRR